MKNHTVYFDTITCLNTAISRCKAPEEGGLINGRKCKNNL